MTISHTIENMVMLSKLENLLKKVRENVRSFVTKIKCTYSFTNCIHPFTVKLNK